MNDIITDFVMCCRYGRVSRCLVDAVGEDGEPEEHNRFTSPAAQQSAARIQDALFSAALSDQHAPASVQCRHETVGQTAVEDLRSPYDRVCTHHSLPHTQR